VLHVKALINNGQYANSLKLLDGMTILPNEGAAEGKIIYEQASLFMAIDLIGKKKYSDAIKMIEKSKEWPERLGVGKPYVVDTRIQDYLNIYCLNKTNKKNGIDALRNSIAEYSGRTQRGSYNQILTINALREMGKTSEADALIRKLSESDSPINKWIVAAAKNDQAALAVLEKDLGENVNFQIVKRALDAIK